jgi:hypothetical protein
MPLLSALDSQHTVAPPGYSRWLIPPAALAVHLCGQRPQHDDGGQLDQGGIEPAGVLLGTRLRGGRRHVGKHYTVQYRCVHCTV